MARRPKTDEVEPPSDVSLEAFAASLTDGADKRLYADLTTDERDTLEQILVDVPYATSHPQKVLRLFAVHRDKFVLDDDDADSGFAAFLVEYIHYIVEQERKTRTAKRTRAERGELDEQAQLFRKYQFLAESRATWTARRIVKRPDVIAFRSDVLNDRVLTGDEVRQWLLERASTEATVTDTGVFPLFYDDGDRHLLPIFPIGETALHRLAVIIQDIYASGAPWRPDQLLTLIFTGIVPSLNAVDVRVCAGRLQMSVDIDVPADIVKGVYQHIQQETFEGQKRPFRVPQGIVVAALKILDAEVDDEDWEGLFADWMASQKGLKKKKYKKLSEFKEAVRKVEVDLFSDPVQIRNIEDAGRGVGEHDYVAASDGHRRVLFQNEIEERRRRRR